MDFRSWAEFLRIQLQTEINPAVGENCGGEVSIRFVCSCKERITRGLGIAKRQGRACLSTNPLSLAATGSIKKGGR